MPAAIRQTRQSRSHEALATTAEDWAAANQRCLMAELAALSRLLARRELTMCRSQQEAAPRCRLRPRSTRSAPTLALSDFERRIVLLCAGMELEGDSPRCCRRARFGWAIPGRPLGSRWPRFPTPIGTPSPTARRLRRLATDRSRSATVRWSRPPCASTSGFFSTSPASRHSMNASRVSSSRSRDALAPFQTVAARAASRRLELRV